MSSQWMKLDKTIWQLLRHSTKFRSGGVGVGVGVRRRGPRWEGIQPTLKSTFVDFKTRLDYAAVMPVTEAIQLSAERVRGGVIPKRLARTLDGEAAARILAGLDV